MIVKIVAENVDGDDDDDDDDDADADADADADDDDDNNNNNNDSNDSNFKHFLIILLSLKNAFHITNKLIIRRSHGYSLMYIQLTQ